MDSGVTNGGLFAHWVTVVPPVTVMAFVVVLVPLTALIAAHMVGYYQPML